MLDHKHFAHFGTLSHSKQTTTFQRLAQKCKLCRHCELSQPIRKKPILTFKAPCRKFGHMIADLNQNSGKSNPGAIQPPIRRRISRQSAEAIAKLVAKGQTETEAVYLLDEFTPKQWFNWKSKRKRSAEFTDILTRTKAARIQHHLDNVDQAAIGAGPHKRADFRASMAALAWTAPERFAPQQAGTTTTNNVLAIGGDANQVAKLIAMFAGQVRGQIAGQEQASLPAPAQADKPTDV